MSSALDEFTCCVHALLDDAYASAEAVVHASDEASSEMLRQVVEIRNQAPADKRLISYFHQFLLAATAMSRAAEAGKLGEVGDWIGWSLTEEITDEHKVELNTALIFQFCDSPFLRTWGRFEYVLSLYLNSFYYYAMRLAAMKEVAEALWPIAAYFVGEWMKKAGDKILESEALLGCQMQSWAGKESRDRCIEITPSIERYVDNKDLPPRCRAMFCLSMATNAGQYSTKPQDVWATRALTEFEDHLQGVDRVQMMVTALQAESAEARFEEAIAEMERIQAEAYAAMGTTVEFLKFAAVRIDFVQPFFTKSLASARGDYVLRALAAWYQVNKQHPLVDAKTVLLCMPFHHEGFMLLQGQATVLVGGDRQDLLERLVTQANAAFGTANTVAYADNSALRIPDRPGVPAQTPKSEWLWALQEAYCPGNTRPSQDPLSQLTLPAVSHPIQAVQLRTWEKTWPIAASLSAQLPDRQVKRVALWSGAGSMTEDMEMEIVKEIFERAGSVVSVFAPDTSTVEDFQKMYVDPQFDVVWVLSHGEFDHWSPESARIQIARDRSSVGLDHLVDLELAGDERRLLFLNICDGARFQEIGMLPRIGLAPALAGRRQATISNLWPVQGYTPAGFGALLAIHLASGRSYFEAYERAMRSMAQPAAAVAGELEEAVNGQPELVQRLLRSNEDWSDIEKSGAPAFFQ